MDLYFFYLCLSLCLSILPCLFLASLLTPVKKGSLVCDVFLCLLSLSNAVSGT